MRSGIIAGVIAGLAAGVVFGLMMTMMNTPDGKPMMAMVAQVVRSDSLAVGWIYHLFNSAIIGGIFGWLMAGRIGGFGSALLWGALYGVAWWVLGGLILMPLLLGMSAFAPLMMEMMRPVAISSLMGHILFGLILGIVFLLLRRSIGETAAVGA